MSSTETEIPLPETQPASEPLPGPPDSDWSVEPAALVRPSRRLARRAAAAALIVAVLLAAYLALGAWLQTGPAQDIQVFVVTRRSFPIVLEEKGELKATNSVDIKSELQGRATIISLVDEGVHVQKGDLLVELASDEIDERIRDLEIREAVADAAYEAAQKEFEILKDKNQSEIRKASLALEMAEINLKKYQEGDAFELQKDAELGLDQAKFQLKRAQECLKDSEQLFEQGFMTRMERDDDRFAAYKADNELTKARIKLEVLNKYTIPMNLKEKTSEAEEAAAELERTRQTARSSEAKASADVQAKQSELEIVRDKLAKAREQKEKAKILAPAEGLVVYKQERFWDESSRIKTGVQVHERQSLIELPDISSMKVIVRVHEARIQRVKEGLSATVTVEGFSNLQFTGKVTKIAVLADSEHRWLNPNLKQFETEILLDGDFTDLKPGATARVVIHVTQLEGVIAVPVQAVFGKGGKYYVFLDESGDGQPVEVEPGLSSDEYVEIKKGLQVGQKIRLAVTDDMKLKLPDDDASGQAGL